MKGPATYPKDHQFGMRVPKGGSNCAKCEYVNGQKCKNEHFVKWNGSNVIPIDVNLYCCDVFETAKAQPRQRFEGVQQSEKEK